MTRNKQLGQLFASFADEVFQKAVQRARAAVAERLFFFGGTLRCSPRARASS
jgi:hypothetical protein